MAVQGMGKRPFSTTNKEQAPEKKHRLTAGQVRMLERSFEANNKLGPKRKTELARELGLAPRQVAVWFQNRRSRWRTKRLERDYASLRASYDALRADNDSLRAQRMGMQSQSAILPWSCVGDSRMDDMYIELDALECAVDGTKKPCNLKFSFLQFITKQFSDELKIGHGMWTSLQGHPPKTGLSL